MLRSLPAVAGCVAAFPASAQIDPTSGIDLVTITAPGNAPWVGDGTLPDSAIGRGQVDYEYRIGKYEVTTAQWVGFFNAAFDRPQSEWIPHLSIPSFWGAVGTTPNTPGGLRWAVPPGKEMIPAGNISWRTAAILCNWYHNGKSLDRDAFLTGAYDVNTFGFVAGVFTDQDARSPGAKYFIPTWDEWLKAAHFDPNKDGPGLGGWWTYSDRSNDFINPGPPGVGEANYDGSPGQFQIPLGAYPNTYSPWGLFDVSGATAEWTESIRTINTGQKFRMFDGTGWGGTFASTFDSIYSRGAQSPNDEALYFGFRIGAVVPAPPTLAAPLLVLACVLRRRREERRCVDDCFRL